MSTIDLGAKFTDKFITRYPAVDESSAPADRQVTQIHYRNADIKQFEVIFWHRLLKRLYQAPLELECELLPKKGKDHVDTHTVTFRKMPERNRWKVLSRDQTLPPRVQRGELRPLPIDWKYLISLPSGGIVELGTRDKTTAFYVAQVTRSQGTRQNDTSETKDFINRILAEANRLRNELFSPKRDFEKRQGPKQYRLFNIYRANYLSALAMLRIAKSQEAKIRRKALRYDARTSEWRDEKKRDYVDKAMLTVGMFYCSTITYFFMALEGFVNLIFHFFLKNQFRHEEYSLEQRLDLGQKLTLMPSLCKGFKDNIAVSSTILAEFKKVQKYRNSLFHSKIEDSLKYLCFYEDGFVYNYHIKDPFLPSQKLNLKVEDVNNFRIIVDKIIADILRTMKQAARLQTKAQIMKEAFLMISVSETGELTVLPEKP